jgi:RNA polymerase sigma factor (TIGR02999 family)
MASSGASTLELTELLRCWADGDAAARDRLMALVYQELRRQAAGQLRRERAGHSLEPTALVHETYLQLIGQDRTVWQNRTQFFAVASLVMRRILISRARARRRGKRGGRWLRVPLDEAAVWRLPPEVDAIDLDRALSELETLDPRKCRVAELRFYAGLSLHDAADALGVSPATVERDWQTARAWLFARLTRRL